jgi:acetolactate synthase-1/2/3 large subunit
MPLMTGSRLFAEMLRDYDVSHVFYVPAIMLGGLAEMESMSIVRVMTHGEKAAAYMADGYARASGKPGICLAQQIGGSNLAAGLRDAYMACAPLIAINGGPPNNAHYKNGYQEVEDFCQFDAVTKFNAQVDDVSRLPDLLRQAFRVATSGTPGPVHLQIRGPHGHEANKSADMEPFVEPRFSRVPPFRPRAQVEDMQQALDLLAAADRPIIVAGGGVMASGAQAEVVALAEKMNIPVATSLNAKAALQDRHPLNVGVMGAYSRSCANQSVAEADLVFFIGSRTGGQLTLDWKLPAAGTRVIQLDIAAEELGRNYPNVASLAGDVKVTLQAMLQLTPAPSSSRSNEWTDRTAQLVAAWRAEFEPLLTSDAVPIRPERICREISSALPAGGIVVSDTGHSGMWTGAMIELDKPDQGYIRCAGSMGWGFPGALGVKCAMPDRAVVCFTGDGAFYFHIAELETAARFGINLVTVVNNNSALNQEIPLWDAVYPGKSSADARTEDLWSFQTIDFAKVAESFGCIGVRVTDPAKLSWAIAEALAMNRPVVIDVVSGIDAFAPKAWAPAAQA